MKRGAHMSSRPSLGRLCAAAAMIVATCAAVFACAKPGNVAAPPALNESPSGARRGLAHSAKYSKQKAPVPLLQTAKPVAAVWNDAPFAEMGDTVGQHVQLCQACEPPFIGVHSDFGNGCREPRWRDRGPIPWEALSHGEYVGPARTPHVPEYRLRVDDVLEFVYRSTREEIGQAYELNVGDQVRVESIHKEDGLDRELTIQPDGTIILPFVGSVRAARRSVLELRDDLEERFKKLYKVPAITVTPIQMNTKLVDLLNTVDSRFGQGGQGRQARITPDGVIQLPGIDSVPAHGLTVSELQREIHARYEEVVDGVEVTVVLRDRAPRYIYVIGEVVQPGRYELTAPTTLMQAIALGGGWNNGGNLREIVVFRRTEDWRLMATRIDVRGALLGQRPSPADEIWLRDSDIVAVPKSSVLRTDDFIDLVFTRGIYGVIPLQHSVTFTRASLLGL